MAVPLHIELLIPSIAYPLRVSLSGSYKLASVSDLF